MGLCKSCGNRTNNGCISLHRFPGGEGDSICQEMYGLLFCYGCKYSFFWLIMPRKILKVLAFVLNLLSNCIDLSVNSRVFALFCAVMEGMDIPYRQMLYPFFSCFSRFVHALPSGGKGFLYCIIIKLGTQVKPKPLK